jgi:hypothetical protein
VAWFTKVFSSSLMVSKGMFWLWEQSLNKKSNLLKSFKRKPKKTWTFLNLETGEDVGQSPLEVIYLYVSTNV